MELKLNIVMNLVTEGAALISGFVVLSVRERRVVSSQQTLMQIYKYLKLEKPSFKQKQ
mgnify:FL=1